MADLIEKELWNFSNPPEVLIFFSAHGVPVSYVVDAGDPYRDQMEDCVHLIMEELKSRGIDNSHTLAYQSRVGPVQWLKPYTDEVIVQLGKHGVKSLLAVPISFVSEHIETLEEIDMEYKNLAIESGIQNWGRVPALGCTSSFISDLANAVIEALPSAVAVSTAKDTSQEADSDPLRLIIKMRGLLKLFMNYFAEDSTIEAVFAIYSIQDYAEENLLERKDGGASLECSIEQFFPVPVLNLVLTHPAAVSALLPTHLPYLAYPLHASND
ncbi:hypothetical protein ACLOJK_025461 [Asimina triloba]